MARIEKSNPVFQIVSRFSVPYIAWSLQQADRAWRFRSLKGFLSPLTLPCWTWQFTKSPRTIHWGPWSAIALTGVYAAATRVYLFFGTNYWVSSRESPNPLHVHILFATHWVFGNLSWVRYPSIIVTKVVIPYKTCFFFHLQLVHSLLRRRRDWGSARWGWRIQPAYITWLAS